MKTSIKIACMIIIGSLLIAGCGKEEAPTEDTSDTTPAVKSQTVCPIMGGKITSENFADHNGKRVFFCCPGCDETFKKDPDKYIKEMEDAGITLASTPDDIKDTP